MGIRPRPQEALRATGFTSLAVPEIPHSPTTDALMAAPISHSNGLRWPFSIFTSPLFDSPIHTAACARPNPEGATIAPDPLPISNNLTKVDAASLAIVGLNKAPNLG